jgi:GST-like protein
MIDLYSWKTSNGRKATIMLEELAVDYRLHLINLGKGDQFTPAFTAINPNQKIPAMVDQDGPGGEPYTIIEGTPFPPPAGKNPLWDRTLQQRNAQALGCA